MADINLNLGSDDLGKIKSLLADLQKQVDKIIASTKKLGAVTDDDVADVKHLAVERKKLENQLAKEELASKKITAQQEKYNQKIKESKGILGGLEKEARDFRSQMKSANSEAEMKRAQEGLKKVQTKIQQAKGTTASWGKALGSFQFKFNALGNIAANVLNKITNKLTQSIKEFTSLEKIIRSNQLTSDKFDKTIGSMKASFEALNRAIAMGDFLSIGKVMHDAANAAEDYILAMDTLGDTQNALNIQNAKARREVKNLQEIYNDTSQAGQDRLAAALKAQTILNGLQEKQERIAEQRIQSETDRVKGTFDLNDEQLSLYKRFIENYNLLTDEQVTALENLETQQVAAREEVKKNTSFIHAMAVASTQGTLSINQNTEAQNAYAESAKDISRTLGFDVLPVMDAIVGTNDEARQAVVSSIIEYENQLAATQKLKNANAAMLGTIRNTINANKEVPVVIADSVKAYEDLIASIDEIDSEDTFWNEWFAGFDETADEQLDNFEEFLNKMDSLKTKSRKEDEGETDNTERNKQESIKRGYEVSKNVLYQFGNLFEAQKQKELTLAGDNAAKQEEIQRKYAKKQQAISIASTIINTAEGIVKVLKDYGLPWGLIPAAAMAALGATEIATIKNQTFAEGGPILGEPHSRGGVNVEAEGGEYVINKRSTGKYKDLIEAINQDDQVRIMDAMSRDKKIIINKVDPYTQKMYELMKDQVQYGEDNEFFYKHKGNVLIKTRKR